MNRREFLAAAAGAPLALAAAPRALGRAVGGTPLALVTADAESHVAAVELTSGRIRSRLPTLPGPRSIQSVGDSAVIAHTASGGVTVVDAPALRVRHVLHGFSQPRYTAAARDGRHAYVTDSARGELVVVDLLRGRIPYRLELDGPARHVSVDPAGRLLWVALGSKAETVAIVDVRSVSRPRLLRRARPPFLAHDVGFSPDGRHVWTTSGDSGALVVCDARTGRVLSRLRADAPPQHVTFSSGLAYVTSGDDGTLHVHSLRDGRRLRATAVPVGSYNVQEGWGRILTPSLERGTLCVLDRSGRLVRRTHVARSSHDACFVMSR